MKGTTAATRVVYVVVGVALAPLASLLAPGCALIEGCPDDIVRDVVPGTYRLDPNGPQTEIGADGDYRVTVSTDRTTVVEEFTRDGQKHRYEYAAQPPVFSALRANRSDD